MGNIITYDRHPEVPNLKMSNGLTAVVWDVLRLATETLFLSPTEEDPLGWMLARMNPAIYYSCADFDLDEMPWPASRFEQDRSTLLQVIDLAATGEGWPQLDYQPRQDWVLSSLATFRTLIAEYRMPGDDGGC